MRCNCVTLRTQATVQHSIDHDSHAARFTLHASANVLTSDSLFRYLSGRSRQLVDRIGIAQLLLSSSSQICRYYRRPKIPASIPPRASNSDPFWTTFASLERLKHAVAELYFISQHEAALSLDNYHSDSIDFRCASLPSRRVPLLTACILNQLLPL